MPKQAHLGRVGEERCAYVRGLVIANRALTSRTHLEEQAGNWLREAGTLPPGNGVERALWEVHRFPSHLRCSLLSATPPRDSLRQPRHAWRVLLR